MLYPMDDESLYYNAVAVALYGSNHKIRELGYCGSWQAAYQQLLMGTKPVPTLEAAWEPLDKHGIRLIFQKDPEYPPLLKEATRAPIALYVKGVIPSTSKLTIAIVGTRRATLDGNRLARHFGHELSRAGCTIVSGLALGIDAAAHEGALGVRDNGCIAVLANGLARIYPETNHRLAENILANGGAIISEYPPCEPPHKYRFLERNRIISGIARGTLVIEAPESSGSLSTAESALEQNRDVFVVPGAITHPNFRGANELIRQGATLVVKPDDILEAYGVAPANKNDRAMETSSPEETLILKALRSTSHPIDVDKIIAMTKLEPRIANRAISFLVIKNLIKENGGGYTI
jgi:DNA processing protein